jgi:hypothetical protein
MALTRQRSEMGRQMSVEKPDCSWQHVQTMKLLSLSDCIAPMLLAAKTHNQKELDGVSRPGYLLLQLQADLAQLQLSHSSERAAAQQAEQQLRAALSDAQAAKAAAEVRLMEAERQLADARGQCDSQERLTGMLRQQLAEQGRAAAAAEDLEGTVQVRITRNYWFFCP